MSDLNHSLLERDKLYQEVRAWLYGAQCEPPGGGIPYELARDTVEDFKLEQYWAGDKPALSGYPVRWGNDPTVYLAIVIHVVPRPLGSGQAWVLGLCRIDAGLSTDIVEYRFISPLVIAEYGSKSERALFDRIRKVTSWYRLDMQGQTHGGRPRNAEYDEVHQAYREGKWKKYKEGFSHWLKISGTQVTDSEHQEVLFSAFKEAMKVRRRHDKQSGGKETR